MINWQQFVLLNFTDSVQFSRSVVSDSLQPREAQHAKPPCPSPAPRVHPSPCLLSQWCHPTISSSVVPFSCSQSFPASGFFPVSQLFTSGGQSIGVSASTSVLPMNTQDWSALGCTGWISLQSKGLSRVFPTPQFKSINSSALSFLLVQLSQSIHDHWKNHRLDQTDLCWQSNVDLYSVVKNLSHPKHMFPCETEQGHALPFISVLIL